MEILNEKAYRALEIDSYSSIKDFLEDRKKYYKKHITKEGVEEEESKFLRKGNLADTLFFSPGQFDDKFSLTSVQAPSGQMLSFVEALYHKSVDCMADDGTLTRKFDTLTKEAYNEVKFDRAGNIVAFKQKGATLEAIIEKFMDSDAELYYRQLMSSVGKSTVELYEVQNAEKTVKEIRNNWVTKEIANIKSSKTVDVYTQFPIIFEYLGYKLKSLLDQLVVDHEAKEITPWDLKTCWDNEKEFQTNWYKFKYYLQAAVYYLAALHWADKEGWKDYKINPMKFIVADSNNYQNPLIYETDVVNLQQGLEGFIMHGRYHPGVNKAIQDLKWHKETNIWEISKENYENKGIVKIKPFIEDEY